VQRAYYVRDRRVEINEVDGVLAIRIGVNAQGQRMAQPEDFGRNATREAPQVPAALKLDDTEATGFDRAGWAFVLPTEAVTRNFQQRALPAGVDAVGKVFQREDGRVVIGTDTVAVKLKPGLTDAQVNDILQAAGIRLVRRLRFSPNLYEARVVGQRDAIDTSMALRDNGAVEYSEPVLIEQIGGRYIPTDPDFSKQWQWQYDGAGGGVPGADVGAVAAWDHTRGAGVRVAVIDNGFDVHHPDLALGIEPALSGYFDDDGNFQHGLLGFPNDVADHGTFCAGMAAARSNNGVGGCGAAPECKLMLVAALSDQVGSQLTLARAVAYCADPTTEGGATPADAADIISCSLGPSTSSAWSISAVLDDAIRFATANGSGGRGTPIFWASSNGHVLITDDQVVSHPNVIAIGRSNQSNQPDNSAFGPELAFLAPGRDVYSTRTGGLYGTKVGTSFAAPCSAGLAALILGVRPNLRRDEVFDILRRSADKIGAGYDANGHSDQAGFGRINARRAVQTAMAQTGPAEPAQAPSVTAPATVLRTASPVFQISGAFPYYAMEVATDPALFNRAAFGAQRADNNFYATWKDPQAFFGSPSYQLPPDVWNRLKVGSRLYYRIWGNNSSSAWSNQVPSTPDNQYQNAPVMHIAPFIEGPKQFSRNGVPAFTVDSSPLPFYAVEIATDPSLFDRAANGARRNDDNFYATWEDPTSFFRTPMYRIPDPVWTRLGAAPRVYYRIWANGSSTAWVTQMASTPDSNPQGASFSDVIP